MRGFESASNMNRKRNVLNDENVKNWNGKWKMSFETRQRNYRERRRKTRKLKKRPTKPLNRNQYVEQIDQWKSRKRHQTGDPMKTDQSIRDSIRLLATGSMLIQMLTYQV
jgi:hypothetical protein